MLQWKAIGVTSFGLVVCATYGPSVDAERAWWPLIKHYYDPMWQCYMWSSYGIATFVFATQRMPSLRFLAPPKGSIAWTVLACGVSGMLAGLLQTQLKVLAQCIRSVGDPARIGCRHAPPGFCIYNLTAYDTSQCPPFLYTGDIICKPNVMMGIALPAYPVHWLVPVNGWSLVPSALLQARTHAHTHAHARTLAHARTHTHVRTRARMPTGCFGRVAAARHDEHRDREQRHGHHSAALFVGRPHLHRASRFPLLWRGLTDGERSRLPAGRHNDNRRPVGARTR